MSLPSDPGVGPSFGLCCGDSWRPDIIGLLEEMLTDEYWLQKAAIMGVSISDTEVHDLTDGASRIVNRMMEEYNEAGCGDLAPPSGGIPNFGTVYSKTYNFRFSAVPAGWTVFRGTPTAGGLHSQKAAGGSIGAQNRISLKLTLTRPAHARAWQPYFLINSTFLVVNPTFLGGFAQSAGARLLMQCNFPDVDLWTPFVTAQQVYATANEFSLLMQVDEKINVADLLGEATLQQVYVEASSTTGNPFP